MEHNHRRDCAGARVAGASPHGGDASAAATSASATSASAAAGTDATSGAAAPDATAGTSKFRALEFRNLGGFFVRYLGASKCRLGSLSSALSFDFRSLGV